LLAITIALWANLVVDFFFAPASSYRYADLNPPLVMVLALWALWDGLRERHSVA
jgi:hypothetical protein